MASRLALLRAAGVNGPTLRARPAACTLAGVQDLPDSDAARRVRDTWNSLAATPWRDFFVASHAGWRDPRLFDAQAAADLGHFLAGLGRRWLARRHVLEIGCGVGRLAVSLAALAHSYTGFDIADAMVQEARRRCAGLANVRLLTGDGTSVPAIARDRRYGVVLAAAVFIHCPRQLIEATVRSAAALLDRDGTFRLQLRVDADDRDAPLVDAAQIRALQDPLDEPLPPAPAPDQPADLASAVPGEALALTRSSDYGGHPFRVAEADEALREWAPGCRVALHRPERHQLYAVLTRRTVHADAGATPGQAATTD